MKAGYSLSRASAGNVNALGKVQNLLRLVWNSTGFNAVTELSIKKATDVSGSMGSQMSQLIHHTCLFIDSLGPRDRITAVRFSGEGSTKCIADNILCDEAGKKKAKEAVRSLRTLSNTVFAEPLAFLLEHENVSGRKVATILTDGCAVPMRRSDQEEEKEAEKQAALLAEQGTPLYVICFSPHADWNFAQRLVKANKNLGFATHVSFLENLEKSYADIIESARNTSSDHLEFSVKVDGKPVNGTGFCTKKTFTNVGTGQYTVPGFYKGEAVVFVEIPAAAKKVQIQGVLNGEKFDLTVTPETLTDDERVEYLEGKGYFAYKDNDKAAAVGYFQEAGDEVAVTLVETSYTTNERRDAQTKFASLARHGRLPGSIGAAKKLTVVELFRILTGDPGNQIIYNPKARGYQRTGDKVVESNWKPISGGVALLNKLVSHKSKMTLTLSGTRPGLTKTDNQPKNMPVSFTFVAGGPEGPYTNEPIVSSYVTKRTFATLVKLGYLEADTKFDTDAVYDFEIGDMSFTNGRLNVTSTDVVGRMKLENHQEVVAAALKDKWNELKKSKIGGSDWEKPEEEKNEREIIPGEDKITVLNAEWFLDEEVPAKKGTKIVRYKTTADKLFAEGAVFEWDWEPDGKHYAFALKPISKEEDAEPEEVEGVTYISKITDPAEAEKLHKLVKRMREITQLGHRIVKMDVENTGRADVLFQPVVNNRIKNEEKKTSQLKLKSDDGTRTFVVTRHTWPEEVTF